MPPRELDLSAVRRAIRDNEVEHITDLIRTGQLGVNHEFNNGYTLLHLAAAENAVDVVNALLALGARLEARDHDGRTPLFTSVHWASRGALRALIAHGADCDARRNTGRVALHTAAYSSVEMVNDLLAAGADFTAADEDGVLPVHMAQRKRNYPALAALSKVKLL